MCKMCDKCMKMSAIILLVLGIVFILQDTGVWDFWNLSWYTVVFLFAGICIFCTGSCPECKALNKKK